MTSLLLGRFHSGAGLFVRVGVEPGACPAFLFSVQAARKLTRLVARNGAGASRQEVTRFKEPDQFRGPFPSLLHLSGSFEGEGLR